MKTSKLSAIITLTALSLASTAIAQEKKEESKPAPPAAKTAPPAAKGAPQDRMKQISEMLGLTDEQKEKVRPIFQEQAKKMQEIFQDANLSQDDKRTKIADLRTTYNAKIKALLTPEQATTWEKMMEQTGKAKKKQ